jgi:hypothetical protein
MLNTIIVLALLVICGWVVWHSKTEDGWDLKKGVAALVVAAGAVWSWWVDSWSWMIDWLVSF